MDEVPLSWAGRVDEVECAASSALECAATFALWGRQGKVPKTPSNDPPQCLTQQLKSDALSLYRHKLLDAVLGGNLEDLHEAWLLNSVLGG